MPAERSWIGWIALIYLPSLAGPITPERTITNQTDSDGVWKLTVDGAEDLGVTVPNTIEADANGGAATFEIGVEGTALAPVDVRQAILVFEKNSELAGPVVALPDQHGEGHLDRLRGQDVRARCTSPGVTTRPAPSPSRTTRSPSRTCRCAVGPTPPSPSVVVDPAGSPFGYVPLSAFGSTAGIGATHANIANFNVPAFEYSGKVCTQIGIVFNGYVVLGGGTNVGVDYIKTDCRLSRCRTTSSPRSGPTSARPMVVASGSTCSPTRIDSWSSSGRACPAGVTGDQP